MEEILKEIAKYPDVSRPIKIYRFKTKWRMVVNGRGGLYIEEEAVDLQECAENVLKSVKSRYPTKQLEFK